MNIRRFISIILVLTLVICLASCGTVNKVLNNFANNSTDSSTEKKDQTKTEIADKTEEKDTKPESEEGVYVLIADGSYQRDIAKEAEEAAEGFYMNYYFSLVACQTDDKNPPGAGEYEGAGRLTAQSDVENSIAGMLSGIDIPMAIEFDMSSKALSPDISFELHEDSSDSDVTLRTECQPIFEGGRKFDISVSAGGYDVAQNNDAEGACPLPMTIEVFGNPDDAVRPALITLVLCEGDVVIKIEGTLSFIPWSESGRYIDSKEFKEKIAELIGE